MTPAELLLDSLLGGFTRSSRRGTIVAVHGHIGAPHLLAMFGVSLLLFKPEWQAHFQARPRSAIICIASTLLAIGFLGLTRFNYR